ncbi:unnamed protein product [Orchesella dallaii]|uniref:Uncharacterized protein n=1 Tax=Orchesella dallaii TaxID=48710 RepID=A0ABP1R448_9HEXA
MKSVNGFWCSGSATLNGLVDLASGLLPGGRIEGLSKELNKKSNDSEHRNCFPAVLDDYPCKLVRVRKTPEFEATGTLIPWQHYTSFDDLKKAESSDNWTSDKEVPDSLLENVQTSLWKYKNTSRPLLPSLIKSIHLNGENLVMPRCNNASELEEDPIFYLPVDKYPNGLGILKNKINSVEERKSEVQPPENYEGLMKPLKFIGIPFDQLLYPSFLKWMVNMDLTNLEEMHNLDLTSDYISDITSRIYREKTPTCYRRKADKTRKSNVQVGGSAKP